MVGGVIESVHGYKAFLNEGINKDEHPGMYLLKGLDLFLVSIVFLIFALGLMRLFTHYHHTEEDLPPWLKIDSFKELKILLWETIIVTMVVFTLTQIASLKNTLTLDVLILPGTVFILSISLYFVKKEDKH
jgi:uncharacterized membrane protein YqhA